MNDMSDYFATERFAAYMEWVQTAYDYPVITRANGSQEVHPYRTAAWHAFVKSTEGERHATDQDSTAGSQTV